MGDGGSRWQRVRRKDAARGLAYLAASAVDGGAPNARRLLSKAEKLDTGMGWDVAKRATQIMGGAGYTDVYPIEKALRYSRLCFGPSSLPVGQRPPPRRERGSTVWNVSGLYAAPGIPPLAPPSRER